MAKHIIEYKLHDRNVPYFIEDGGYFEDGINPHKKIGLSRDDTCCYIPLASLVELTNAQLVTRVEGLTIVDEFGATMSTQEKTSHANTWLSDRGL